MVISNRELSSPFALPLRIKMVDIHSHILPGVDDGSGSIEESIEMLINAVKSGVDTIVATPHLLPGSYVAPTSLVNQLTEELQEKAEQKNIPIQIIKGRECYLSPETFEYEKDLDKLTIADGGKYMLVEFPFREIPRYVDNIIFELRTKGIVPIIAHVERYLDIIVNPNRIIQFIQNGCVIQVNAGSFLGNYGHKSKKTAEILLEYKMIHLIASDMHTSNSLALGEAFQKILDMVGEKEAMNMFEVRPRAIIKGELISIPELIEYRRKTFRNFWGLFDQFKS